MRVVVIGAGFGGLGAAHALLEQGIRDVVVLERAEGVGGVWRENDYPEAACDVPSPLYSWSWAPNPDWSHRYGRQAEIRAYVERTARERGLTDLVRYGEEVTALAWDDSSGTWTVRTAAGATYEADVVVSAVGQLSEPRVPDLPGRDDFAGPAFHSALWRHDVPLGGRRVVVVGTGASAVQFVPGIVDEVAALTVVQRTPTYVLPRPDQTYSVRHRRAFRRFPALLAAERRATFALTELYNRALSGSAVTRPLSAVMRTVWRAHLRRAVRDPELRRRLTPADPVGCRRTLFSNDWYPALAREHVTVADQAVTAVEPTGVRTADGRLHEADVLIWGTGFAATDFLGRLDVVGLGGRTLRDQWADGASAYLGTAVPGFPNLFCVYGPGTNLGGSSIIGMLEAQAGWIAQVVRRLADEGPGAAAEVDEAAHASYDRWLQERLDRSVFSQCSSWYNAGGGRVTTNWPGLVREYADLLASPDWAALRLTVTGQGAPGDAARDHPLRAP